MVFFIILLQREKQVLNVAVNFILTSVCGFQTGNADITMRKTASLITNENIKFCLRSFGPSKAEISINGLPVVKNEKVVLRSFVFYTRNQVGKEARLYANVANIIPGKMQCLSRSGNNNHVLTPLFGSPENQYFHGDIKNFDCRTSEDQSFTSKTIATAANVFNYTAGRLKQLKRYLPSFAANTIKTYLPDTATGYKDSMQMTDVCNTLKEEPKTAMKRELISRGSLDRKTHTLVFALRDAQTSIAQLARIEELSRHLAIHPQAASIVVKSKVIPCLLKLRSSKERLLRDAAREVLALIGHTDPVGGRGIRILSLDGGGTKGLISIEIMKHLEKITHKRIYELFDYIAGVSTGALIAIMAGVFRVTLEETELMYKEFSSQMFSRNKLVGAGKLFMSHAYYDTEVWENILKENIGFKTFLQTTRDPMCPKIAAISVLMNVQSVENFIFRNYAHSVGRQSHYAGSLRHKLWEAIRASSAAPGYFEEFELAEFVHQDGGLLTNNPTAIAIHESQLLWPSNCLQCVVSVGTGKYEPTGNIGLPMSKTSLKSKVAKIVQSATDTEAVHTILHDLLKPATYYRFNPYISEDVQLDEIRPDKWEQIKVDTKMYCRKNQQQLDLAAQRLVQPKPIHSKVLDWCNLKWSMIG